MDNLAAVNISAELCYIYPCEFLNINGFLRSNIHQLLMKLIRNIYIFQALYFFYKLPQFRIHRRLILVDDLLLFRRMRNALIDYICTPQLR